jgi:hypothetical protein
MGSHTLTCYYGDDTSAFFSIPCDGRFIFDANSEPLVDIHHQPDLVEKKGAWEVVHDKLYIVGQDGNLITIQADMFDGRVEPMYQNLDGSFFDDGMKNYREERGWKYPKSWDFYECPSSSNAPWIYMNAQLL